MSFYMRSPVYTPNDPVKSVKQLHSWLYQLNENLRFMFSNLDSDNFSSEFQKVFSLESANRALSKIDTLTEEMESLMRTPSWEKIGISGCTAESEASCPSALLDGNNVFLSGSAILDGDLLPGNTRTLSKLHEKYTPRKTQTRSIGPNVYFEIDDTGALSLVNGSDSVFPGGSRILFSISYAI